MCSIHWGLSSFITFILASFALFLLLWSCPISIPLAAVFIIVFWKKTFTAQFWMFMDLYFFGFLQILFQTTYIHPLLKWTQPLPISASVCSTEYLMGYLENSWFQVCTCLLLVKGIALTLYFMRLLAGALYVRGILILKGFVITWFCCKCCL